MKKATENQGTLSESLKTLALDTLTEIYKDDPREDS